MAEPPVDDDTLAEVRSRLRRAGIPCSEEELVAAAAVYRHLQAGLDGIYQLPEVRYAEPALLFRAQATEGDWVGRPG